MGEGVGGEGLGEDGVGVDGCGEEGEGVGGDVRGVERNCVGEGGLGLKDEDLVGDKGLINL